MTSAVGTELCYGENAAAGIDAMGGVQVESISGTVEKVRSDGGRRYVVGWRGDGELRQI